MYKKRLCLALTDTPPFSYEQQLELFKQAGFDGFFPCISPKLDLDFLVKKAKETDMFFQSIHAAFGRAADMWKDDEEKAKIAMQELYSAIDDCTRCNAPILVVHPYIGFEKTYKPTEAGLIRYEKIVRYAEKSNVRIAFENVEGEAYLNALMERFSGSSAVGFCWDSGHELCYNRSKDMLALYGDRLFCTHLNDNLGVKAYDGTITWTDDLHLLPFDGVNDWEGIAARLHKHRFTGDLTFELNLSSKPNRHENDVYRSMPFEVYLAEAYKRACRVAALLEKAQNT